MVVSIFGSLFFLCWVFCGLYFARQGGKQGSPIPYRYRTLFVLCAPYAGFLGGIVYGSLLFKEEIKAFFGVKKKESKPRPELNITVLDEKGRDFFSLSGGDSFVTNFVKLLLYDAMKKGASDIFMDPRQGDEAEIRFRIEGSIRTYQILPEKEALPILSTLKVIAGMDIAEKRRPQDGSFSVLSGELQTSFRAASVGVFGGEKLTLRVIAAENSKRTLENIGLSNSQLATLIAALKKPSGMILICGPTGSGKTSTLYTLLNEIDYGLKNVISIEDPIERVIPEISQMEVNSKAGITFASLLRNALRQNPDVICLGEIRDEETAQVAVHAAQTGHQIVATIHSNDNIGTLVRLTDLGVGLRPIAASLNCIVSQRLIRKLCPHCKQPAMLNEMQLEYCRSNGVDPAGLYSPGSCAKCDGTGYLGRLAVFELLVMDDSVREVLESPGVTVSQIRRFVEQRGGRTFASQIMGYVVRGVTSWDEYDRTIANK